MKTDTKAAIETRLAIAVYRIDAMVMLVWR